MNAGKVNRRNTQRASALKAWSQLTTVAIVFLLILPRCAGCRSPVDPLLEKIYGVEIDPRDGMGWDRDSKFDEELHEEFQELIRKSDK